MNPVSRFLKKGGLVVVAGILLFGNTAQAQDAVAGKAIFEGNCKVCHSIDADLVGPALKDVHERRGDEWLVKFISNSQELIKSGDADAVAVFEKFNKMPMPAFEGSLSKEDMANLVAYIKAESDKPAVAVAETPANDPAVTPGPDAVSGVPETVAFVDLPPVLLFTIALAVIAILLIVAIMFMLLKLFVPMMGDTIHEEDFKASWAGRMLFLMRGDTTVMTGKAKDVIHSNHDFDGIQEYDNDLPPWWKYMFYVSIVFAIGYMLHYHVFNTGMLQEEEYQVEMQQAALLASLNADDPNAVTDYKVLTDAAALENGKTAYIQNCAACHGQNGEGTVGPNLTDEYWLHGGDVNEVFKTIKYGVPSKGMVPWQGKLTKDQMLEVSSYILSLQGSNPENGKEPQGEKEGK